MRTPLRPLAFVLGAALLSGCATSRGGSLTTRFVREGTPALDFSGLPLAPTHAPAPGAVSERAPVAKPRPASFGATIESADQQLAAALLVEKVSPTTASHLRVADEYYRLGILDSAYDRVTLALQKAPRLALAHERLARIWRDWGLPDRGLASAHRATFYDRRSASAENTLGTILAAVGKPKDAREAFARALSLQPDAVWALNNLCYMEFTLGRFQHARASCETALTLNPGMVAARNNLALTHAAAGDLERAGDEFRAAGDAAAAQYNMGIMHLAARDYRLAAESFEQAMEERPWFTAAKERAGQARKHSREATEGRVP